jgi:hypothetical protein
MKKVFNILFDGNWGTLLLMQALFFGGLLIGSREVGSINLVQIASGLVWVGSFALWAYGRQNNWS